MPINGEYTWSETTDKIEISIPLKGVSVKKVDVFTTSKQLKISYSPFLLDVNLFNDIDEDRSRAVLKNGMLKISLPKKEIELWNQLEFKGTKQEIQQRRAAALKEREEKVKRQDEQLAAKKVEEERRLTRQHMALEERERQRIDDIKAVEKEKAEEAMHKTFATAKAKANETDKKKKKKLDDVGVDSGVSNDTKQEHPPQDFSDSDDEEAEEIEENALPPPRTAVQTSFTHTPRLFKTPSRESTVKQEKEFILKNRDKNLKKNALLNVDAGIDDIVDPAWLNSVNSKVEKSIANARKD